MKDATQKAKLYRHFSARGWYALPEIPVFHKGGVYESRRLITDIDVLALRPRAELDWELVLGDCKTLKEQSPANRAIWLRGLMDHFSATSGVIILRRKQPIEPDHKLFASSFRVTLLDEEEFGNYDRALVFPEGSSRFDDDLKEHQDLRRLPGRFPKLKPFCEYLFALAWNEGDLLNLLRRVIGEARSVANEIDPQREEHHALILEASGIFAIGLARSVGVIFNQFLQPKSAHELDEALKVLIWGGRSQYNFIAKLRNEMIASKGKPSNGSELALPEWERFLELVREMLESPALSFEVPQLLRRASASLIRRSRFLSSASKEDLLLLKYSMMTVRYLCRAGKLPPDAERELTKLFVVRQSELVHSPDNVTPSRSLEIGSSANIRETEIKHVTEQIELPVEITPK